MADIYDIERRVERYSLDSWDRRSKGGEDMPPILYFNRKKPPEFDESGLYVGFQDFRDVRRYLSHDVAVTTAFHALVYHFSLQIPGMHQLARRQLYNNPANRASWNDSSYTDRYFLHGTTLIPYSAEQVAPDYKIKDVGKFGRELLRKVLFEDELEPVELTEPELFEEPEAEQVTTK